MEIRTAPHDKGDKRLPKMLEVSVANITIYFNQYRVKDGFIEFRVGDYKTGSMRLGVRGIKMFRELYEKAKD